MKRMHQFIVSLRISMHVYNFLKLAKAFGINFLIYHAVKLSKNFVVIENLPQTCFISFTVYIFKEGYLMPHLALLLVGNDWML